MELEQSPEMMQVSLDHPRVFVLSRKLIALHYARGILDKCGACGRPILEGSWFYSKRGTRGKCRMFHITCAMVKNIL